MKNIFISSTFIDMQAERDLVQERVLPALRDEARKYGDNVGVIDLRWGVDTSTLETEEGAAKVLKVCLDEIDRSHPYMLIFLGERYGTMMREEQIEKSIRGREDKYSTDDYIKSITALEVEYGALSEKYGELNHCVVCFREPVVHMLDGAEKDLYAEHTEEGKRKLEALKERIKRDLGEDDRLITYSCTWDKSARQLVDFTSNGQPLENVLTNCFVEMFQDDWKEYESLSWQDKEQLAFRALMESKLRSFVGREALLEEYYQSAVNRNCPIILQGEVGSGKTAIMCKLVERLQKEGKNVFAFFAGAGNRSNNAESLVNQLVYYVEDWFGIEEHFEDTVARKDESLADKLRNMNGQVMQYDVWMQYLKELCGKIPEGERLYVCIDALDQLSPDEHTEALDFFVMGENIQVIASCTDDFGLPLEAILDREIKRITALSEEDAKSVAGGILASYSRNAYAAIEEEILKKKCMGNPLYISLLIQRLNMMDTEELQGAMTEEEIISLGTGIIRAMPEETEAAIVSVIRDGMDKIRESEEIYEALQYIAVSRNGLRMSDLQGIFAAEGKVLPALNLTLLMKYLDSFFYVHEDDRIDFTHKVIRQGLLMDLMDREGKEEAIKEHLKTLEVFDGLRIREGMYYARIRRDEEFARCLIGLALDSRNEELKKAIKNEAVEDEGALYCELLRNESDEDDVVKGYFGIMLGDLTGVAKKEVMTSVNIGNVLTEVMENRYEKLRWEDDAYWLMLIYYALGCRMMSQLQMQEGLLYLEKGLKYAEIDYNESGDGDVLDVMVNITGMMVGCFEALDRQEEASAYCEKAWKSAEELYAKNENADFAVTLCLIYNVLYACLVREGKLEEIILRGMRLLEIIEESRGEISFGIELSIYIRIGNAYGLQRMWQKAFECFEDAIKAIECRRSEIKEHDLQTISLVYSEMAQVLCELNREQEALVYAKKGMKWIEELGEITGNEQAVMLPLKESYQAMANILSRIGNKEEAQGYYEKGLKHKEDLHEELGNEGSLNELYNAYFALGYELEEKGQLEEALSYYEKALECVVSLYEITGKAEYIRAQSIHYTEVGNVLRKLRRYEDALVCYEKALKCIKRLVEEAREEEELWLLAMSCNNMGLVLVQLDRPTEALFFYKEALKYKEKQYEQSKEDSVQKDLSYISKNIGTTLAKLRRGEEALTYFEQELRYAECLKEKMETGENIIWVQELSTNMGKMLEGMDRKQDALPYYEKAVKCKETLYEASEREEDLLGLLNGYLGISRLLKELDMVEDSLPYYEKAIACAELLKGKKGRQAVATMLIQLNINMGKLLVEAGHCKKALDYFEKAFLYIEETKDNGGNEKRIKEICTYLTRVGTVLVKTRQLEEALSYFRMTIERIERLYEESGNERNWEEDAILYLNMGHVLHVLGRESEALLCYEKALRYVENRDEKNETRLKWFAVIYNKIYTVLKKLERIEEALLYCEKEVKCKKELYEQSREPESLRDLAICCNNVGNMLCDLDRYEEAEEYLAKNMRCREELYRLSANDSNLSSLSVAYNNYGWVLCELGRAEEALRYLQNALQHMEELPEKNPAQKTQLALIARWRNLAKALSGTNRLTEALEYGKKAVELDRELYLQDDSDKSRERVIKSLFIYAETLFADNQLNEACEVYTEALEHCKSVCEKTNSVPNARIYVMVLKGLYLSFRKVEQIAEAEEYLSLAKEEAKKLYELSGTEKDKMLLDELLEE